MIDWLAQRDGGGIGSGVGDSGAGSRGMAGGAAPVPPSLPDDTWLLNEVSPCDGGNDREDGSGKNSIRSCTSRAVIVGEWDAAVVAADAGSGLFVLENGELAPASGLDGYARRSSEISNTVATSTTAATETATIQRRDMKCSG